MNTLPLRRGASWVAAVLVSALAFWPAAHLTVAPDPPRVARRTVHQAAARAWLSFLAPAVPRPETPEPVLTPYGRVLVQSVGDGVHVTEQYGSGKHRSVTSLLSWQNPGSLTWIRATGPWIVYRAVKPGSGTAVGAISLAVPGTRRTLMTAGPNGVDAVAVGSHRVAVETPTGVIIFALPTGPGRARVSTVLPTGDWTSASDSVRLGYDVGGLHLPGLPTSPPRYPGLVSYHLGHFEMPLEAPPGWMVTAPASRGQLTALEIVNPHHPGQWIAVILNPHGQVLSVPAIATATVALSDVTLAFDSVGPHHTIYNGVLYPNPSGGTSEIIVSLPESQHPLARRILDSVGLPY